MESHELESDVVKASQQGYVLSMMDQLEQKATIPIEEFPVINSPIHSPICSPVHSPIGEKYNRGKSSHKLPIEEQFHVITDKFLNEHYNDTNLHQAWMKKVIEHEECISTTEII